VAETDDKSLEDELFTLEEGFWLKGEDFFLDHVDDHCLLAFPTMPEFHGVHSRDEVAATARQPNRWSGLEMTGRQLVRPGEAVAIVSYRADVTRADGQPYAALIGSAYAKRADGWKLAFHQHSPIATDS
jgi:ketosteroid isomerase-like protein